MDANDDDLPPRLDTRRLILQPLGAASMQALCAREPLAVARTCGFAHADDEPSTESMLRLRIESLARTPAFAAWVPRAIVRRADGVAVGHINFHTAPDPEYLRPWVLGAIEPGFSIFAASRRRGYATEALATLIGWARRAHAVARIALSVAPANLPSRTLIERLGFVAIGVWQDAEGGPEVVYAREALPISKK